MADVNELPVTFPGARLPRLEQAQPDSGAIARRIGFTLQRVLDFKLTLVVHDELTDPVSLGEERQPPFLVWRDRKSPQAIN